MKTALINGKVILENDVIENVIIVVDQVIEGIYESYDLEGLTVIDLEGHYLSPGFIDIHIHGTNGSDVMDGTREALCNISENILKNGVTSFLATTMTLSQKDISQAFENVKLFMNETHDMQAQLLGIHVEGPFINKAYKGAQNDQYIITPEIELVENYTNNIKLMTVAPEVDGMLGFIKEVKALNHNIKFSIGHSAATYEEAVKGYDYGIESTTHLFNGMTGLHHRKPGIIGAVFKKKPYFEVIADQVHLHSAIYDIVGDAVGTDKMILITDAMCACQMQPGTYELGGQKVIVDQNSARMESGHLAGSILKMNHAVKNVYENTHYSISEVVNMATRNPANLLGLADRGVIRAGYQADFVVLDTEFNVVKTIVNNKIVFRKDI